MALGFVSGVTIENCTDTDFDYGFYDYQGAATSPRVCTPQR
jgi:hypothetical protein